MSGRLYGVSVGPGDPGLITLNALQVLKDCKVVCYPSKKPGEDSVALEIVRGAMSFEGKELVELVFSMDPEDSVRRASEKVALDKLCGILDRGDDVAMVVLGDIGVYSTYMYIDEAVRGRGYETSIVAGIPSFVYGASKARLPLMLGNESFCVIPMAKDSADRLDEALKDMDNIVVMKAFKSIGKIAELMKKNGVPLDRATVISNLGMDGEYIGPLDPERDYGYFTTVLIKRCSRI